MRLGLIAVAISGAEPASGLPPDVGYILPINSRIMTMTAKRPNPPLG